MSIESDRERLSQAKMLEWLQRGLQMTDMVPLYLSDKERGRDHVIYCALIPSGQIKEILSSWSWDLRLHTMYYEDGEKLYGATNGIEPLVIDRSFYEIKDSYREISEEFRLFHNLYHDEKTNKYIKIDEGGNESVVAVVEPNCVQIRLKEIRQFLAVKEMYLSIQFDCLERSGHSLEKLGLKKEGSDQREELMSWAHDYGESNGPNSNKAFSRLVGKRLVKPLPEPKSGLQGFAADKKEKHVEFIIGVDDDGDEITHTADPDALANNFGVNPNAPHYLTPVYFRKQVLDKYYQQPSKYSVEDSLLRCGGLWCMEIDNHHDDKVCVWLGDLGRDLSYTDQLHWRAHNILVRSGQIAPKAIEHNKVEEGYAILDELVGFCESDQTDGSVNHDEAIYGLRSKP